MVGTFDVANFGDLLFPVLAKRALKLRGVEEGLELFSLRGAPAFAAPTFSSFSVRAIQEFPPTLPEMRGLIVGGGDLIRFDPLVVHGYGGDGILPFPECLWLLPALVAVRCGIPVVWNSPGVVGAIPHWAVPFVAELVAGSAYVSVRDKFSQRSLKTAVGETVQIHVVPDSAFGLEPRQKQLQKGHDGQFDVLVHASVAVARTLRMDTFLLRKLRRLRVALVEVGTALGDDVLRLAALLPAAEHVRYSGVPDLLEVLENSRSVISSSLHLTIGASAAEREVMHFAHPRVRKHCIILNIRNEQNEAAREFSFGRNALSSNSVPKSIRVSVAGHWDAIVAVLGAERQQRTGPVCALDIWNDTCDEINRARKTDEPAQRLSLVTRALSYRRPERIVLT